MRLFGLQRKKSTGIPSDRATPKRSATKRPARPAKDGSAMRILGEQIQMSEGWAEVQTKDTLLMPALSLTSAAAYLDMSPREVKQLMKEGQLGAYQAGNRLFVTKQHLRAYDDHIARLARICAEEAKSNLIVLPPENDSDEVNK